MNVPDHGRSINKYEFSDKDPFALHCERSADIVATWPAWKQKLLGVSPTRETPRVPIDTERSHDDISRRLSLQKVELLGDRPRVVLPASDYFYDRAMKRSAEIKAGIGSTPVVDSKFEARFKALQERYDELEKRLAAREREERNKMPDMSAREPKVPNMLEGRKLNLDPCRGCQRSGSFCHVCKYGGP